ncbi:MAG: VWA domain-containing protein, partial [Puniceicoccales bacterium]
VSASMGYSDGLRSRLEQAVDHADQTLSSVGSNAPVGLVLFSDRATPVVSPPTDDHAVVRSELSRVTVTPGGSNLEASLSAALSGLESLGGGRIVVFSDGQKDALPDSAAMQELADRAAVQGVTIDWVPRSSGQATNLAVTNFAPQSEKPVVGNPTKFRAVVKNAGETESKRTKLSFVGSQGTVLREEWVSPLQPGAAEEFAIELTFRQTGWQTLTARLEADGLAADDVRTIGFRVSSRLPVGVVSGPRSGPHAPDFFIAAAIAPVPPEQQAGFPIEVIRVRQDGLSDLIARDVPVIVLAGVASLSRGQADALMAFVNTGGALWVLPPSGEELVRAFMQAPPVAAVLPGSDFNLAAEGAYLAAAPPYNHPVTSFWNASSAGSLEGFLVQEYLTLTPNADASVALTLQNGDPLFITQRVGSGRVFFSAIPLDGQWSDLPLSPQFVPVVQRTIQWLSGLSAAPASVAAGEPWVLRVEPKHACKPFYVQAPGDESPREFGLVEYRDGQALVTVSNTYSLGGYAVYLEPEGEPIGTFAVNLDAAESNLAPAENSALAPLVGGVETGEGGAPVGVSWTARLPELWTIIAALILVLGAVEFFFSQRFSQ